jgi:hypothetical protein
LGVQLEDEGDTCLCVRTEPRVSNTGIIIGYRHHFVDLETGETFSKREDYVGHYELAGFADQQERRRLL